MFVPAAREATAMSAPFGLRAMGYAPMPGYAASAGNGDVGAAYQDSTFSTPASISFDREAWRPDAASAPPTMRSHSVESSDARVGAELGPIGENPAGIDMNLSAVAAVPERAPMRQ